MKSYDDVSFFRATMLVFAIFFIVLGLGLGVLVLLNA